MSHVPEALLGWMSSHRELGLGHEGPQGQDTSILGFHTYTEPQLRGTDARHLRPL